MFVRRHKLRASSLRSLLSTPGLVACYLPYLDGSGQSLTDWSGQGNHAQLGSTTGADTNDPTWGSGAMAFGGDDYVTVPNAVRDAFAGATGATFFTVASTSNTVAHAGLFAGKTGSTESKVICLDSSDGSQDADSIVLGTSLDLGFVCVCIPGRLGATPQMLAFRFIGGVELSGRKLGTDWTKNTTSIPASIQAPTATWTMGRHTVFYFIGSIYAQLYFNRALSDAEVGKTMTNLHKLLAGQGVTIA